MLMPSGATGKAAPKARSSLLIPPGFTFYPVSTGIFGFFGRFSPQIELKPWG
jgi:hypothetical protein